MLASNEKREKKKEKIVRFSFLEMNLHIKCKLSSLVHLNCFYEQIVFAVMNG